jgi:hypothetical protein
VPRTIKVGIITDAEGAPLDAYFHALADPGGKTAAAADRGR